MIGEWVRKQTASYLQSVAALVVRTGISANAITVMGVVLCAVVGYLIAANHHLAAGLLLILAGFFDGLDGSVARLTKQQSPFGAFWDSTLDRLAEALLYLGVVVFYMNQASSLGVVLAYIAVIGSLLVSYARARAEGLGLKMREGLMTRFERLAVLIVGLMLGQLWIALWILAIMSVFTVIQRTYIVRSLLKAQSANNDPAPAGREG